MISTDHLPPPTFHEVVDEAIVLLEAAYKHLIRQSACSRDPRDEGDLLYLSSLAQLAGCRGCHFGSDEVPINFADSAGNLLAQLVDTHERLVQHLPPLAGFAVLEFVNEVGALCRGMRRYVQQY